MPKGIAFFLCLCVFSFDLSAQHLDVLVLDGSSREPLPYAHLHWQDASDSLFAVAGPDGQARLRLGGGGAGQLMVSHVGYRKLSKAISPGNDQDLVVLELKAKAQSLNEVVVTGQAGATLAREAVRQIRVIDRKRLQSQAAPDLRELLQNELNLQVSQDPVLGSQLSMQGLSGQKVKILIDGVPVIGRTDGNIDLSQINLSDIERVEIVEGPMAVQYGTDAIAGTINLISRRENAREWGGQLNAYGESAGRLNLDASLGGPVGKVKTRLNLGRYFFSGFDPDPSDRSQSWNPKEQYFANLGLQARWGSWLFRSRSDYFDEEIRNPGNLQRSTVIEPEGNFAHWQVRDDHYYTRRINQSIYVDRFLSPERKLKGFVAYNHFRRVKNTLLKDLSTGSVSYPEANDAQDTSRFDLWSSRLFYEQQVIPHRLAYQVGYDFIHEINRGPRIAGQSKDITDAALFASLEYRWGDLVLQPGLRYAYNSRYQAPLISSLALRWQWHENWVWRGSYGRGFRAPSLKELYFLFVDANHNILGNPDLEAETAHNWQSGITWQHPQWEIGLRGFYNRLRNEIRLVSVVEPSDQDPRGLFENRNIDRSESAGLQVDFRYQTDQWRVESGWALTGLKNALAQSESSPAAYQRFWWGQQLRLNASSGLPWWQLRANVFSSYTAPREDLVVNTDGDLASSRFDGFAMLDFSLERSFWQGRFRGMLGVKNMLDNRAVAGSTAQAGGAHSSGTNQLLVGYGRSYFVRLEMKL